MKKKIKTDKKHIARSSNGRMYPSGGYHLGSSPSLAAREKTPIYGRFFISSFTYEGLTYEGLTYEGLAFVEQKNIPGLEHIQNVKPPMAVFLWGPFEVYRNNASAIVS